MKKSLIGMIFILIFMSSCFLPLGTHSSGNVDPNTVSVDINDSEIQACFKLVNEFRAGKEAYYWNEDNITKTSLVGKLGQLVLDEELCKAAKVRAEEASRVWSHTRPNGTSCFTVYDDLDIKSYPAGENLAAGNSSSSLTFVQLKEDNYKFEGQGHRRIMLSKEAKKIGIAYVYVPGSQYKYYWAMELSR